MKANPMETAPKDGRFIVVITAGYGILRLRWDGARWRSVGLTMPDKHPELLGWVEDIEPPIQETLEIGSITFRGYENLDISIRDDESETDILFTAPFAQKIYDWLRQWFGKD